MDAQISIWNFLNQFWQHSLSTAPQLIESYKDNGRSLRNSALKVKGTSNRQALWKDVLFPPVPSLNNLSIWSVSSFLWAITLPKKLAWAWNTSHKNSRVSWCKLSKVLLTFAIRKWGKSIIVWDFFLVLLQLKTAGLLKTNPCLLFYTADIPPRLVTFYSKANYLL